MRSLIFADLRILFELRPLCELKKPEFFHLKNFDGAKSAKTISILKKRSLLILINSHAFPQMENFPGTFYYSQTKFQKPQNLANQ